LLLVVDMVAVEVLEDKLVGDLEDQVVVVMEQDQEHQDLLLELLEELLA
jgi:hypothetical protein